MMETASTLDPQAFALRARENDRSALRAKPVTTDDRQAMLRDCG